MYKRYGDLVQRFDGSNKAIGILFLSFKTQDEQLEFASNPDKWIDVILE